MILFNFIFFKSFVSFLSAAFDLLSGLLRRNPLAYKASFLIILRYARLH